MPLSDHPEEFRYLILALQRQGSRQLNSIFAELRLTTSQAEAIEVVGTYGPMTTKEVGQYLICESGSPSRLLAAIAAKGLIVASQSTADRRATLHELSAQGREVLERIYTLKQEFEDKLSESLADVGRRHPGDTLRQLADLLVDPELSAAMKRRYPHLVTGKQSTQA